MVALEIAACLVETSIDDRLEVFCEQLRSLVDGSWALAMRVSDSSTLVGLGAPPDTAWLAAFFAGSRHIPAGEFGAAPGDMVWVHLDSLDVSVAAGRSDRPFHTRERLQVALLGRVANGLVAAPLHRS